MNWILNLVGALFILCCATGVIGPLRLIPRCSAGASRVLHGLEAVTALIAAGILIRNWTWIGLLIAVAFSVSAFLFEMIAGRFWAIYLLRRRPESVDVFLKDP